MANLRGEPTPHFMLLWGADEVMTCDVSPVAMFDNYFIICPHMVAMSLVS